MSDDRNDTQTAETVEIDREALEDLVEFFESHGSEYGWREPFLAAREALRVLGKDRDPTTYWRDSWGEKPPREGDADGERDDV